MLPLSSGARLAVFGITSYDLVSGGTGSGDVNEAYTVSLVGGLRGQGFRVDARLERLHGDYWKEESATLPKAWSLRDRVVRPEEMALGRRLVERIAGENDAALVAIGRVAGEFRDRELEGELLLTEREHAFINSVADVFRPKNKSVVAVLNIGDVVETVSWRDQVDAIVVAWQGGQEAGNAITDVLSGRVSPSGKLPMSFPRRYADVPSAKSFPGEWTTMSPSWMISRQA